MLLFRSRIFSPLISKLFYIMDFTPSVIFATILLSVFIAGTNVTDTAGNGGTDFTPGGTDFGGDGGTDFGGDGGTDFGTGDSPKCTPTTCPEIAVCHDSNGFIYCECPVGKTGSTCYLDDPCMKNTTNCPKGKSCFGDCNPNIACEGATGVAHCRGCVPGWEGMQCEIDTDECTEAGFTPCLNDGVCVNTVGSYRCTCKTGWTASDCNCKQGTSCDIENPTGDASQTSPSLINCLIILSVSLVLSL